ncbi:outer dense fiber protein 3-like [Pecten maximus]|uniref:outer dense fiber protein 3-like n=1 Tax=Pecten maximus TaxID=6579 RepID=UPI001457EF77|nr:outer dense fiber protein 3-like [Pecten maximus]
MRFSKKPITLACRWFDPDEPTTPGPADYSLSKKNLKTNPTYTNRQRNKPSFPDSLNYTSKEEGELPGPGSYNLSKNFVKNDSPAYSMRQKIKKHGNENPAPNSYKAEQNDTVPGGKKAPSFSMGKRFEVPDSKASPGPAAYSPSLADSTPKYTMTSRPRSNRRGGNPAANAYKVPSAFGQTSAATFKSRASPYVYSGFRTTKITEEVPSV